MGQFIKKYWGVIAIGGFVLFGYILLTDVFRVLSPFLFPSIFAVIKLFPRYINQLFTGLKSSLYLLTTAYVMAVICAISLGT